MKLKPARELYLALQLAVALVALDVRAEVVGRLDVGPATVGRLTEVRWSLTERETGKVIPALLTVLIAQVEREERVFLVTRVPMSGEFNFRFHFTDGSPHRVVALGETEKAGSVRQEKMVSVTATSPPPAKSLAAVFSFLGVTALGVVTGRVSRRKR